MIDEWSRSREFWNKKARENPYWYASSYVDYERPDVEEFWASGFKIWTDLKAATGYEPMPTHTVVEIGCGVGRLTRAIAPEVQSVIAFDISDEMLEIARRGAAPNVDFRRSGDDLLASLPDRSAAAVIAYCVFQHLPGLSVLETYLQEMVRVAKDGGVIVFTATPRSCKDLPLVSHALRLRRRLVESLRRSGPLDLYYKEWYGIRPSRQTIMRLAPIPLQSSLLHGDKWLFWGHMGKRSQEKEVEKFTQAKTSATMG